MIMWVQFNFRSVQFDLDKRLILTKGAMWPDSCPIGISPLQRTCALIHQLKKNPKTQELSSMNALVRVSMLTHTHMQAHVYAHAQTHTHTQPIKLARIGLTKALCLWIYHWPLKHIWFLPGRLLTAGFFNRSPTCFLQPLSLTFSLAHKTPAALLVLHLCRFPPPCLLSLLLYLSIYLDLCDDSIFSGCVFVSPLPVLALFRPLSLLHYINILSAPELLFFS